jgi:hypothetical protein
VHRRTYADETLGSLAEAPELHRREAVTTLSAIHPVLDFEGLGPDPDADPDHAIEVPAAREPYFDTPYGRLAATRQTMDVLASFASGPAAFLRKTNPDLRQRIFQEILAPDDPVMLEIAGGDLVSAHVPDGRFIRMRDVLEPLTSVLGKDARVINRAWSPGNGYLWLDTAVVDRTAPGAVWGGDESATLTASGFEPQVGDITMAGLSVFRQNSDADLYLRLYLERLFCTNGMTSQLPGAEFRLKGSTASEIIDQMESAAQQAFDMAQPAIDQFYELRDHPVRGDLTQMVARVASDVGLSDARVRSLALRAPEISREAGREPTVFDVVNLVTNEANAPDIQPAARRQLIRAGGVIAAEHGERCAACQSILI